MSKTWRLSGIQSLKIRVAPDVFVVFGRPKGDREASAQENREASAQTLRGSYRQPTRAVPAKRAKRLAEQLGALGVQPAAYT